MPEALFGGFAGRTAFTGNSFVRSTRSLTDARAGANGTKPIIITHLFSACSGRGASRDVTMFLGGADVDMTVAASSSAQDTGWINVSDWLTAAGVSVNYGFTALSGQIYFPRSSTATPTGATGDIVDGSGYKWPGFLGMYYRYVQVPAAPSIVSVTPNTDGDEATVVITAPGDNGGSAVTGYRIQRALDAGFTTGVATIDAATTTQLVTGLTPGQSYYWRVVARNYASDTAGILGGTWSATVLSVMPDPGLGRIYSGGTFVQLDGMIRNLTDTAWEELDGRIRDLADATWVELGA
jgi:hypothetical protein